MKVVFDEKFFDEIDHFHPNFDESVPNSDGVTVAWKSFCVSFNGYFGAVSSCLWLVHVAHAHSMRLSSTWTKFFFF